MNHLDYFQLAAQEAQSATCLRARCGSVIVSSNGKIIGRGNNSPPNNDESQRTCTAEYRETSKPKYDKTCCIHAEWNAILDACKNRSEEITGSTLYFMRIDKENNFTEAGQPFCTVCSRLVLQSGVSNFALWNNGPDIRSTDAYNIDSYAYHAKGV